MEVRRALLLSALLGKDRADEERGRAELLPELPTTVLRAADQGAGVGVGRRRVPHHPLADPVDCVAPPAVEEMKDEG